MRKLTALDTDQDHQPAADLRDRLAVHCRQYYAATAGGDVPATLALTTFWTTARMVMYTESERVIARVVFVDEIEKWRLSARIIGDRPGPSSHVRQVKSHCTYDTDACSRWLYNKTS